MLKDIQEQYLTLINNTKNFTTNIQQSGLNFIIDITNSMKNMKNILFSFNVSNIQFNF